MPMPDYILWKQLTRTDFNSMLGLASPAGEGGGARHISLGVANKKFPIDRFLSVLGKTKLKVEALSDGHGKAELTFASIPGRRHGEWMISDQRSHRHPAWSLGAGFPAAYDPADPPVAIVLRVGNQFHARLTTSSQFAALTNELPNGFTQKGIAPATDLLMAAFHLVPTSSLNAFEEFSADDKAAPFDPNSLEDGRQKMFAAIVRRQGQGKFRDTLLSAYSGRCAVTRSRTAWVLEAAHIVPYLGNKTNVAPNGLLLRSDVHTLFDLGLISIEPGNRKIRVSSLLRQSPYQSLDQRPLSQPGKQSLRPSTDALTHHFARFRK